MDGKMRVTIHQPEHFPYMGFFQKMAQADLFIILDNVNFRKNYFQNRNKIKNTAGHDEWFTIPVPKKSSSKKLHEVYVSDDLFWRSKILKKFKYNFNFDASFIYEPSRLVDINMNTIKWSMKKLRIDTPIVFASDICNEGNKTQLLVNLLKGVGATTYISGPSGKEYLDLDLFGDIEVEFFEPKVENYYSCVYNILKRP
jgi:hypothetical protein